MTPEQLEKINLKKWPGMMVMGKRVELGQAMEILIRTSGFYFSSNEHAFDRQLYEAAGVKFKEDETYFGRSDSETYKAAYARYRILNGITYLCNHQIVTAYVGGPYGWMNWGGEVVTSPAYNIGKWPDAPGILEEWRIIAEAFPYLDLRCQLYDKEECEEDPQPLVEYVVKDGKAKAIKVKNPITLVPSVFNAMDLMRPGREIGCTIAMFKKALEYAEGK